MTIYRDENYELSKTDSGGYFFGRKEKGRVAFTLRVFFDELDIILQGNPYDIEYELIDSELNKVVGVLYTRDLSNELCEKINDLK